MYRSSYIRGFFGIINLLWNTKLGKVVLTQVVLIGYAIRLFYRLWGNIIYSTMITMINFKLFWLISCFIAFS